MTIFAQLRRPLAGLSRSTNEVVGASRALFERRRSNRSAKPGLPSLNLGGTPTDQQGGAGRVVGTSFALLVAAPTLLFLIYASLWESSGYVAESRVTVQASQKQRTAISASATSLISRLAGGGGANTEQDSYIVLNYIKSSAIIADIGGRDYLQKVFSKSDIDFFSRLPKGEPTEELVKYWRSRVSASVDTISGILTFKVTAYAPPDAWRVAQDIDQLSEKLINKISLRSRQDALDRAADEVQHTGGVLVDVRKKLLSFRNNNDLIDPGARAASLGEMIGKLTLEKIDAETSLSALAGSLSVDSPTARVTRAKLATLTQQIDDLKAKLTAPNGTGAVASQIADYERLKLDEQFAEKIYVIAKDSYLRARQELDRQQLYLVTIVPPTMPEQATYPKIIASTLLLFVSLLIFWSIGTLIWASIRDQME
jgi:capsular polysaccharide transport system permease protein